MNGPVRIFCGFDSREAIGWSVFAHSVIARASRPVSLTPLASLGLPQGTNAFTLSRFLVPWLCGFEGRAIFMDASDMLMLGDVAELDAMFDPRYAVQVVKHADYETRNPEKYVGTSMASINRDYPRKNWASVAVMACGHPAWRDYTMRKLAHEDVAPVSLLDFRWLPDALIGALPPEWNVLADEGQELNGAKVLHWTSGSPAFEHYRNSPGADLWHAERAAMERIA